MAKDFTHDEQEQRYTLTVDDAVAAVLDYRINGNSISFTHTFTPLGLRNRGYAADVVEYAVNDVEQNSTRRVVPMCSYVGVWFERHPERAALLERAL